MCKSERERCWWLDELRDVCLCAKLQDLGSRGIGNMCLLGMRRIGRDLRQGTQGTNVIAHHLVFGEFVQLAKLGPFGHRARRLSRSMLLNGCWDQYMYGYMQRSN